MWILFCCLSPTFDGGGKGGVKERLGFGQSVNKTEAERTTGLGSRSESVPSTFNPRHRPLFSLSP